MSQFSVDTSALRDLAARLAAMRSELNGVANIGSSHSGLGPHTVTGSVEDFCIAWESGIKQVSDNIDAVSTRVTQAAGNYDTTESTAAGSYESGGGGW
jgi:hypothetical protein